MFNRKDEKLIINWLSTIHNDLVEIKYDNQNRNKNKKDRQVFEQLKGFRDSLLLDACSGVGYIHEGKFYANLIDLEKDVNSVEEEIPVDRVISVEYLLHYIDQMLGK